MVRAKMVCESKEESEDNGSSVVLRPVTGESEENKSFYKWTPSGQVQLNTVNVSASAYFEVGREYYVDFNLAD